MTAKKAVTAALIVLLAGALITAGVIFLPKMITPADPANTPGVSGTETPGTTTPDNTPGATDTTPENTTEPDSTPDAPKDPVVLLPDPENINAGELAKINRNMPIDNCDNVLDEIYGKYGRYLNENISMNCVKLGLYELMSIHDDTTAITSEALKKVNDFLKDNDEEPLDTTDPKQRIAALWIAASLYYDPDYTNESYQIFLEEWPGHRFDIGHAFAHAKYSDTENIESYEQIYSSGYANLFNIPY